MRTRFRVGVAAFAVAAAGLTVGCGSKSEAPAAGGPRSGGPPEVAAGPAATDGKGLFDQNCAKCHGGKGKAPDLSAVGGKHDAAWITAHTKNPKDHNPMSKMPAFEGKLTEAQIKLVADHLAALK